MTNSLEFKKQFFVTGEALPPRAQHFGIDRWSREQIADLTVWCEHSLEASKASSSHSQILILGTIIDPDNPFWSNIEIARELANECERFDRLEQLTARMAGRWVLIAEIGCASYLYHDAGGLKPVFRYSDPSSLKTYFASQPSLLADIFNLRRHEDRDDAVASCSWSGQWPPYVYPYDHMRQLLPNHRIGLADFSMERFWPRGNIATVPLATAVESIEQDLERTIYATMQRRKCSLSLTGGYDSRLLASIAESFKRKLDFFTLCYRHIPRHDAVLPKRIARILDLEYDPITSGRSNSEIIKILERNASWMCLEKSRREIIDLKHAVGERTYLQGIGGELIRGFYQNQRHSESHDAESLIELMRFRNDPIFMSGFNEWVSELPDSDVDVLDLLYWEICLGIWASSSLTFKEGLVEILPPLNSRRLLEAALGVAMHERTYPYNIFRTIIHTKHPKLERIEFNSTRTERVKGFISRTLPLPWRIRRRIGLIDTSKSGTSG